MTEIELTYQKAKFLEEEREMALLKEDCFIDQA